VGQRDLEGAPCEERGFASNAKPLLELAHALGIGYGGYTRMVAEVLVDTVTYVVCAGVGLDVSSESIPYVAGSGRRRCGRRGDAIRRDHRRRRSSHRDGDPRGDSDRGVDDAQALGPAA
jgi:hypothetical protein